MARSRSFRAARIVEGWSRNARSAKVVPGRNVVRRPVLRLMPYYERAEAAPLVHTGSRLENIQTPARGQFGAGPRTNLIRQGRTARNQNPADAARRIRVPLRRELRIQIFAHEHGAGNRVARQ